MERISIAVVITIRVLHRLQRTLLVMHTLVSQHPAIIIQAITIHIPLQIMEEEVGGSQLAHSQELKAAALCIMVTAYHRLH